MQDATITLSDGRTLAYAEYGDPAGRPVIWCHDNPGSRREPDLLEPMLLARNRIRVIAPDRPGIGQSSPRPQRRLEDWPIDLAALTAALELRQFSLLGVGAGAPYALASLRAMAHRLTGVALVSSLGPLHMLDKPEQQQEGLRYLMRARRATWRARWTLWRMQRVLHRPERAMTLALPTLAPADEAVLHEPRTRQSHLLLLRDFLAQGTLGPARDAALAARDWRLALREIAQPVHIWHGDADRIVPPALAVALAGELPESRLQILPNEGHFSTLLGQMEQILATMCPSEDEPG